MTGPTPEQLHHLADRARRGVLLPAEHDQLAAGITAMAARITTLEHVAAGNKRHVQLIVPELERAEAAIERVRAIHTRVLRMEALVCACCGHAWPCSTIQAIEAELRTARSALARPEATL